MAFFRRYYNTCRIPNFCKHFIVCELLSLNNKFTNSELVTKNYGGLTNEFFLNPPIRAKKLKFRLIKTLDQLCKSKGVTRKTGKSGLAD